MKDLTQGSIAKHVVAMAVPIGAGLIFQTLYYLVDLYFVARLGHAAIAGVGTAGTVSVIVLALTQVLGTGTMALVAHASGRKAHAEANVVFNQAMLLSAVCVGLSVICGYAFAGPYSRMVAADPAVAAAGATYLRWYTPGLGLQFVVVAMGSALRGSGIVRPTMLVQMLTVILNVLLAPILISGWGTNVPLGVSGAGLASTIAIGCGVLLLWSYFAKLQHKLVLDPRQWRPRAQTIKSLLNVGLPAGGEFFMIFVIMITTYLAIRGFGPAAQAGFVVSYRVMQAFTVPVLAIAFGAAAVAGQNFGAGDSARVRETFRTSAFMMAACMLIATLLCQWKAERLVGIFTDDRDVVAVGVTYLAIVSWNFVANGVIFSCSSMFQGMGNTWPALTSAALRLLTYVLPAAWLTARPRHELTDLWYIYSVSVWLQAATSLLLLQGQFRRRLALVLVPAAKLDEPKPVS